MFPGENNKRKVNVMSETSVSGAASVPGAAADTASAKQTLIEGLKAKLLADIEALEAAAGVELNDARAELETIGTDAETFFGKVEAWFKKHF